MLPYFIGFDPKITFKGQKTLFVFRRNSGEAAGNVKTTSPWQRQLLQAGKAPIGCSDAEAISTSDY